jgi:hypothetical protein
LPRQPCDGDELLGTLDAELIVLGEPAVATKPSEGALHDPVGPDDLKAWSRALDDTELPAGMLLKMLWSLLKYPGV